MLNFFLKLKHWQIFLFAFALPIVLYFVGMSFMMANMIKLLEQSQEPNPLMMFDNMKYFFVLFLIPQLIHFAVFWSKGVGLHKYLPSNCRLNLNLFKATQIAQISIFVLIVFASFYFISNVFPAFFTGVQNGQETDFVDTIFTVFPLIMLLQFALLFAWFYGLYFVAKTIKSIQLNREALVGDYIAEFFLLWFYYIGVWFTQPVVNKIVAGEYKNEIDEDLELGRTDDEHFS